MLKLFVSSCIASESLNIVFLSENDTKHSLLSKQRYKNKLREEMKRQHDYNAVVCMYYGAGACILHTLLDTL